MTYIDVLWNDIIVATFSRWSLSWRKVFNGVRAWVTLMFVVLSVLKIEINKSFRSNWSQTAHTPWKLHSRMNESQPINCPQNGRWFMRSRWFRNTSPSSERSWYSHTVSGMCDSNQMKCLVPSSPRLWYIRNEIQRSSNPPTGQILKCIRGALDCPETQRTTRGILMDPILWYWINLWSIKEDVKEIIPCRCAANFLNDMIQSRVFHSVGLI